MVLIEFIVLVFFGFGIGKQVIQKRSIEAEVLRLEQEIGKLERNQDDLGNLLKYVQTDNFIEQEARNKLNLVREGENLVVIPEVDLDSDEVANIGGQMVLGDSQPKTGQPLVGNIKLWWKYFFDNDSLWLD